VFPRSHEATHPTPSLVHSSQLGQKAESIPAKPPLHGRHGTCFASRIWTVIIRPLSSGRCSPGRSHALSSTIMASLLPTVVDTTENCYCVGWQHRGIAWCAESLHRAHKFCFSRARGKPAEFPAARTVSFPTPVREHSSEEASVLLSGRTTSAELVWSPGKIVSFRGRWRPNEKGSAF